MRPKVKTEKIEIRCTPKQKARVKLLARLYAGGSISEWVLRQAIRAPRLLK